MKKIMAVLLSLAVLFSFAACEAKVPSVYGKQALSVTPVVVPTYVEGETLNPADVQLRVVYDDNTNETFTGAELGMTYTTTQASYELKEGMNDFTVAYGVSRKTGESINWDVKVYAYNILGAIVDPSEAATTVSEGKQVSTEDLVYSAVYGTGDSKVVDESIITAVSGTISWTDTTKAAEDDVIAMKATAATANFSIAVDPAWNVTITEAVDPATTVDSIVINQIEKVATDRIFNIEGATKQNTLGSVNYEVVITFMDGETTTLAKNDSKIKVVFDRYTEDYVFTTSSPSTYAATVTYTSGTGAEAQVKASELTVDFADDYPTKVTVNQNDSRKEYTAGDDAGIPITDFTFTATAMASGASASKDPLNSSDFSVTPDFIKFGKTGSQAVTFTYLDYTKDECVVSGVSSVRIAAAKN